jgi:nucleotide-binding universal stress UspA family protein
MTTGRGSRSPRHGRLAHGPIPRHVRIREILFPTDFSGVATEAGRIAAGLARDLGARLHVLHVIPPVTDPTLASEDLAQAVARLKPGRPIVTQLLSGLPARRIVTYARDKSIGLIVMGSHGRTGLRRALLGSVAAGVVRRASCPVLTVRIPSRAASGVRRGRERSR